MLGNGRAGWFRGGVGFLVMSGMLGTATPAMAAPQDAAIVLVGLILGGARDLGGHKMAVRTVSSGKVLKQPVGTVLAPGSVAVPSKGYP
ncbi:MAG: hypothetical protein HW380_5 [Magnetococcales bacterium]|nr:hypothetical protein [Magnetococcales bacterium]HIJ85044.1 hypothetical protein [Magnetococcales bacterium]